MHHLDFIQTNKLIYIITKNVYNKLRLKIKNLRSLTDYCSYRINHKILFYKFLVDPVTT